MKQVFKIRYKDVTHQTCGIAANAVFRGNLISLDPYIRKEEKLKISHLSFHFKKLEKKQ